MNVCLDSWAVLAWLDGDEPATAPVEEAFEDGRPWMSWLNLGEVAYQVERHHGAGDASSVVRQLRGALALDEVSPDRVLAAAKIKAAHPIAFADCFAAATAVARDAVLYTGDPELIGRELGCRVRDLRSALA